MLDQTPMMPKGHLGWLFHAEVTLVRDQESSKRFSLLIKLVKGVKLWWI